MSKKRRTKRQKQTASSRHNFSQVLTVGDQQVYVDIPQGDLKKINSTPINSHTSYVSHAYVAADVRKTLSITTILIGIEIVFYFILKLNFVGIPGIDF